MKVWEKRGGRFWLLVPMVALVLSACGDSTNADISGPASAEAAATDEMAVVVAGAVARLTTYNSFGSTDVFDRVNIVDRYGSPNEFGMLRVDSASALISPEIQTAIETALAPMSVTWVSDISAVIGDGDSEASYETVGAVLSLGRPEVNGDRATLVTGVWCGFTCGAGGTFALERTVEPAGWTVVGLEGQQWIS